MTERENILRAYTYRKPDRIPVQFSVNASCAHNYPTDELDRMIRRHPRLFRALPPDWSASALTSPPWARVGQPYNDPWGCRWETAEEGIMGVVTRHPLADWASFETFQAPDPGTCNGLYQADWAKLEADWRKAKVEGVLRQGGLPHGFFFLLLSYLRGYENLMFDMADEDPRLPELIDVVEKFDLAVVRRIAGAGAEIVTFAEDLGAQTGPLLSPSMFRRYVKPAYRKFFSAAKSKDALVYLHSDGHILDLVDDLIEVGVNILNPQDTVNGIDKLAAAMKGRVAIVLDIDRQKITRFGTPAEIDDHIREAVSKLNTPLGGLGLIYGLYPGVPLENAEAVMTAMEKYSEMK